jgi:hypothetical protein
MLGALGCDTAPLAHRSALNESQRTRRGRKMRFFYLNQRFQTERVPLHVPPKTKNPVSNTETGFFVGPTGIEPVTC